MKEHLLAIFFLVLLFLLYMAPMPDSFLNNNNIEQHREIKEEQIDTNQETEIQNNSQRDTTTTSVVAATRL